MEGENSIESSISSERVIREDKVERGVKGDSMERFCI